MHIARFRLRHSTPFRSRRVSLMVVWTLTAVLLPLHSRPAYAATIPITIAVPQFDSSNIGAWQLNQQAVLSGNKLHLTSAVAQQAGTAFYKNRASLANQRSFSAYFVMAFSSPGGSPPGGADGMVFTIQTLSNNAGSMGGGMGYEGITPSVGIEFDTWRNTESGKNDPNDNHVGLNVGGSVNSLKTASPPGVLQTNTWHTWVDYNGATNSLEVRMNLANDRDAATLVLSETRNLTGDVGQDVFIGFTAATGDAYENHDITALYFHNDYLPGGIDTRKNTYTHAPSALTVSASPTAIENDGTEQATITATVYGPNNQRMSGEPVQFSTDLGTLSTTTATTDANGEVQLTLTSRATGSARIRATVTGGVYGETTVTIHDTLPPNAPTITSPSDGSLLANPRPPISGTAEPGSTVTIKEGSVTICTAVTNAGGAWTCTPTSDLSADVHTVTATATDHAGNSSPAATTTFTIDTVAPTSPLINSPTMGSTTPNQRPPISGTAEPGSTVTIKEGSVTICTAVTNAGGAWTCTPTSDLSADVHTVTATTTDHAGNVSPAATTTFTIDTTAPIPPTITSPINASFTRNQRPSIDGTAEPNSTVTVTEGTVVICTAVTNASGNWSCTPTSDLSLGQHMLTATATDDAGNVSPAATTTFTIDTTAPIVPIITGPSQGSKTANQRPPINGTAEPSTTVTVTEGTIVICIASVDVAGQWSCTPTSDLRYGQHTITATTTDAAGNTSPAATTTFRVYNSLVYVPLTGYYGYPEAPVLR